MFPCSRSILAVAICLLAAQFASRGEEPNPFAEIDQTEAEAARLGSVWKAEAALKSSELFRQAAAERLASADPARAIADLREAAFLLRSMNRYDQSKAELARALNIARTNRLIDEEALIRCDIVRTHINLSEFKLAEDELLKLEKIESDSDAVRSLVLFLRGDLKANKSEYESSLPDLERAVGILSSTGPQRELAAALLTLGYSNLLTQRYDAGKSNFDRSFAVANAAGDLRSEVFARVALAAYFNSLDQKQDALHQTAIAFESFPDGLDPFEYVTLTGQIADIYEGYSDYPSALRYREAAFKVGSSTQNSLVLAAVNWGAGKINRFLGRNEDAIRYLNQCAESARKADVPYVAAICMEAEALVLIDERQFAAAVRTLEEAREISDAIGGARLIGTIENDLGRVRNLEGKHALARMHVWRSLEINRRIRDLFAESENLYQLARIEESDGNHSAALEHVRRSVELTDSLADGVYSDRLRSSFVSSIYDRYELMIRLLLARHRREPAAGYDIDAFEASEQSRARVFREMLALASAGYLRDADPELVNDERKMRQTLNVKSEQLSEILGAGGSDSSAVTALESEIDETREKLVGIQSKIRVQSPALAKLREPAKVDLKELKESILDEDTVLLEFALGKESSYLWLVEKSGLHVAELPGNARIEAIVDRVRTALNMNERRPDDSIDSLRQRRHLAAIEFDQSSRELSEVLFSGLAPKLAGKKLIIVADGALHRIPISALPFPGGGEPFLLATSQITYAHSAASLKIILETHAGREPAPESMLIYADPVFETEDPRLSERSADHALGNLTGLDLRRLPASAKEAETIAESASLPGKRVVTGLQATRGQFLSEELSRFSVIHLATHGFFDGKRPELSGIAFSRFDNKLDNADQLLSLNDIYDLKLNADLVVVSACETGAGSDLRGEGVESISSGFMVSGARSVVASLWRVDDDATSLLMKEFYERLLKSDNNVSEAMRSAQAKLRENPQYRSPYYWAAFTNQGDPSVRTTAGKSPDFGFLIVFAIPLMLGLLLYLKRLRDHSITTS